RGRGSGADPGAGVAGHSPLRAGARPAAPVHRTHRGRRGPVRGVKMRTPALAVVLALTLAPLSAQEPPAAPPSPPAPARPPPPRPPAPRLAPLPAPSGFP